MGFKPWLVSSIVFFSILGYCYGAPNRFDKKMQGTNISEVWTTEGPDAGIKYGEEAKERSDVETLVKRVTPEKKTVIVKLNEGDKDNMADAEPDMSTTRLASGNDPKEKDEEEFKNGSDYWGDMAGSDDTSLDDDFKDVTEEDLSGGSSSGERKTDDSSGSTHWNDLEYSGKEELQSQPQGEQFGMARNHINRDKLENNDSVEPVVSPVQRRDNIAARDDSSMKNSDEMDSISPYLERSTKIGLTRDEILKTKLDSKDSVGPYLETNTVIGHVKDTIAKQSVTEAIDSTSDTVDSVGPYLEKKGQPRDSIAKTTSLNEDKKDSVGPYIKNSAKSGQARNEIANPHAKSLAKSNTEDSIGPYVNMNFTTAQGRNKIESLSAYADHREADEEDTVGPFVSSTRQESGKTRDAIVSENEGYGESAESDDVTSGGNTSDEIESGSASIEELPDYTFQENSGNKGIQDESRESDKPFSSRSNEILSKLERHMFKAMLAQTSAKQKKGTSAKLTKEHDIKDHLHKGLHNTSAYVPQPQYSGLYPYIQAPVLRYQYVPISHAEEKGAVCLDGSTPGYFYRRGVGKGKHKWIIYLQGGAWCDSKINCYNRSQSNLGSSLNYDHLLNAEGILSHDYKENLNFYDWNVVYVPYCDGASFTGNRTKAVNVDGHLLYFRGKRILSALLDDLMGHGLEVSKKVLFTGTSAGGLAVMLNADYVRSRLRPSTQIFALSDSGVFLDQPNMKGISVFPNSMKRVYNLHNSAGSINPKCAAKKGKRLRWKCMFPQYFVEFLKTRLYIINPLHDSWQLANVVGIHCTYHPKTCSKKEMAVIKKFRKQTLNALKPVLKNPLVGLFADACVDHGQIIFSQKWNQIRVRNRSMQGAFNRWTLNEAAFRRVVDPESDTYPFNPTCWSHLDPH